MTTCLSKSCSFGLPRVPFGKLLTIYVFNYFPFGFDGRMWDLIVSVPDHCLSFYFSNRFKWLRNLVSFKPYVYEYFENACYDNRYMAKFITGR